VSTAADPANSFAPVPLLPNGLGLASYSEEAKLKNQRDVVCLSHLRWGFVFQRPNHLMSRFAARQRVFFVEEPVREPGPSHMEVHEALPNLWVCTPHVAPDVSQEASEDLQRTLLERLLCEREVTKPLLWFYTPMALPLTAALDPSLVVYDCMDELSGFQGAPPELVSRERQLFSRADLVFTGGQSLYEAKRLQHAAVAAFPSSVDARHFASARSPSEDPPDQRDIPPNRLGFFGVIDERMDLSLLATLARARPHYQLVMIGPVVKISEESLPQAPNIHYLGPKSYDELPAYIAGWQVALMPFALNDATRFISPTKTLEYMAAGKPCVSTAIRDVVSPYGESGLVAIANEHTFPGAVDTMFSLDLKGYRRACDRVLERTSWDKTWAAMAELIDIASCGSRAPSSTRGSASCSTI
jgi:glycosyltransferase involved in cell wall biosynthesis